MTKTIKINFTILVFLLSINFAFGELTIYSGGNVSALQPEFSNFKVGHVFGIHKNWGNQKLMISSGISYSARRSILKNKNFVFYNSMSGYYLDIHVSVDYLEIPVLLKLYKQIDDNIKAGISLGPSLAIAICDNTESKKLRYFNFEQSEDTKPAHIDYWESDEWGPVWAECSVFYMNLGLLLVFSEFYLEARYNYAMNDVNTVAGKIIQEKFHSLNLFIGVEIF